MTDKRKILVVEDSRSVRQQVREILTEAGYDVVEAVDGVEGLEMIQRMADIAMVIADINMPRKTGLEMVEEAAPQIQAGLPVIMMTTEGRPAYIKRAKAAGARGWIVKPFEPKRLVTTANRIIDLFNRDQTGATHTMQSSDLSSN
jgi:two-component system, chemotaxis family, chemotaxis protein CheY